MSNFIRGFVIAAMPILIVSAGAIASPALASPACMTLQEARQAFPGDHLYWHGRKHCWDNVGKSGKPQPAADAQTADAAAAPAVPDARDEPVENEKPAASAKPAAAHAPAVPFIADDPSGLASWSPPSRGQGASDAAPPPPAPVAQREDASAEEANVVIGAPDAKPGTPDYLLEHCCWPPAAADTADNASMLPRMAIASAGAFGIAAGLWLFVYRRRRPRLARVETAPSIHPEPDSLDRAMMAQMAGPPRDLDERWEPESPDRTLARYAPKNPPNRQRTAAREPYGVS
jgi:hypothetical protein